MKRPPSIETVEQLRRGWNEYATRILTQYQNKNNKYNMQQQQQQQQHYYYYYQNMVSELAALPWEGCEITVRAVAGGCQQRVGGTGVVVLDTERNFHVYYDNNNHNHNYNKYGNGKDCCHEGEGDEGHEKGEKKKKGEKRGGWVGIVPKKGTVFTTHIMGHTITWRG